MGGGDGLRFRVIFLTVCWEFRFYEAFVNGSPLFRHFSTRCCCLFVSLAASWLCLVSRTKTKQINILFEDREERKLLGPRVVGPSCRI